MGWTHLFVPVSVVLATVYMTGGALLNWVLDWWAKRHLSIRVVVDSGKSTAN